MHHLMKPSDPMFRFTIGDVLWLMVVVGMGIGWGTDRRVADSRYLEFERSFSEEAASFLKDGQYIKIKSPKGGWIGVGKDRPGQDMEVPKTSIH